MKRAKLPPHQRGFTLIEVAIAVVIMGFLLGGAVVAVSAQLELKALKETEATMALARDALLGFAAAQGRLPCPATAAAPGGTGEESPNGGGNCTVSNGFVPAMTLGIAPTDAQGFLLDAWGQRIRYAVTTANGDAFTSGGGMQTTGLNALSSDLRVCNDVAPCVFATPGASILTNNAVAVLASGGRNAAFENALDANENTDADRFFVFRTPSTTYDDTIIWISPFPLYNRMLAAGTL